MPVTVGNPIILARQMIPDMPQTLPIPIATAIEVAAVGSTLPAGVYYVIVSQRNEFGETLGDSEIGPITVGAGQGIQITSALLPTAIAIRAYLTAPGGGSLSEYQFIEGAVSPFTISTPCPNAGAPPNRNTAYLADTDGQLIGAGAMFGWLNDALRIVSRESNGLLDYCGVRSVMGQPMYQVPGQWNEITSIWYDGYWMMGGDRGSFWRRNAITSAVLSSAQISVDNGVQTLEVYPQPARTASVTTLASPMGANDTTATVVSANGFLLPFGFMQVDSEIMSYAGINGSTFTGLIRGLGGSIASAHATSAPVNELNIFWSGRRQAVATYQPGNALTALPVPDGWNVILADYMSGRAKMIEHDGQTAGQLQKEMLDSIKSWVRNNKGVARRRQIGGNNSPSVYYPDMAGGWILN